MFLKDQVQISGRIHLACRDMRHSLVRKLSYMQQNLRIQAEDSHERYRETRHLNKMQPNRKGRQNLKMHHID